MQFAVRLCRDGLNLLCEGTTINLSQMGASIRTDEWSFFQVDDQAILTCFLPPVFTGHNEFIALQGEATVRRIDPVNQCVAVEFAKSFKQLEPVHDVRWAQGARPEK
jgi:hypothetical protein